MQPFRRTSSAARIMRVATCAVAVFLLHVPVCFALADNADQGADPLNLILPSSAGLPAVTASKPVSLPVIAPSPLVPSPTLPADNAKISAGKDSKNITDFLGLLDTKVQAVPEPKALPIAKTVLLQETVRVEPAMFVPMAKDPPPPPAPKAVPAKDTAEADRIADDILAGLALKEKPRAEAKRENVQPAARANPVRYDPPSVIGGYRIGTGDKVRVTVYGEADLSNVYLVDGEGNIAMPLAGVVPVSGKTLPEVQAGIVQALQDGYIRDPDVTVAIAEYRPFYIMGEVRRPGSYNYIEGMNVLKAVVIGGGYTHRAKTSKAEIVRADADYDDPMVVRPDAAVMPGDIITIDRRFF